MRELKLLVALILALGTFTLINGCGGQAASTNAAMPAPAAPAPPNPPSSPSSTTISDIQKLGGWENCTAACTNTPSAVFSLTQGLASPSMSGASARFQLLAGTQPFGSALWFKFLGSFDSATHFVYDLFFYIDNPSASQALEFNVSQSANGSRYSFSTQCDLAGQQVWRVWEPVAQKWIPSSVPCVRPPPNTWNHLIWEFERDSMGNVIFTAVTVNGNRGAVNLSVPHVADNQSGLDVAFQTDANLTATPYSVWLDKISLTYW
ncbi:MAG TPA: hypothetical protein VI685_06955 [Candidatus Angelobacter sp.]